MEALQENDIDSFLDEGMKQKEAFDKLADENAVLLHRVFAQTPEGIELLAKWKNELIMLPSILPESTQFGAGLTEGMKAFVRNVIVQVQSVEQEL
jgi:hypothetical protein